ncbi:AAA family ATPase [Halobacteriovorax sp. HFRX-2_2]|uniref:AAA family ATPase n=1 Tax=unclassified Halobacteriovorax TaxID=2639665 RepID=UPI0037196940
MKLIYMWINSYQVLKDQEFNFSSNYTVKKEKMFFSVKKNDTINGFYNTRYNSRPFVQDVSAIVGGNASGKTTALDFLYKVIYDKKSLLDTKYVVVYEKDKRLYCIDSQLDSLFSFDTMITKENGDLQNLNFSVIHHSPAFSDHISYFAETRSTYKNTYYNISTNFLVRSGGAVITESFLHPRKGDVESFFNAEEDLALQYVIWHGNAGHIKRLRMNLLVSSDTVRNLIKFLSSFEKRILSDDSGYEDKTTISNFEEVLSYFDNLYVKVFSSYDFWDILDEIVILCAVFEDVMSCATEEERFNLFVDYLNVLLSRFYTSKEYRKTRYEDDLDELLSAFENSEYRAPRMIKDYYYFRFVRKDFKSLNVHKDKLIFENFDEYEVEFLRIYKQLFRGINALRLYVDGMSTGEKKMFELFYRLNYVNTLIEQDSEHEKNVIILLDEIEAFYHPLYQQSFITTFLKETSKLLTNIDNIQIILATHSPFVLSDIFGDTVNILGFEPGNGSGPCLKNSFAANIGDLLKNEYFLKNGFVGDFAKLKIEHYLKLVESEEGIEKHINELEVFVSKISDNILRNYFWGKIKNKLSVQSLIRSKELELMKIMKEIKDLKND